MKQFTNIPINRGPFKENTETSSNFTILVFLQYVISSLMHQKVWFSQKNSDRNRSYFKLLKDFQKRKLIILYFFPPLAVLHVGHTIYPRISYQSADNMNFRVFSISVKLHGIFHQPHSVAAEILIKIIKHINPHMMTFIIFSLTNPNQK